jgi:hypothetical protein
MAQNTFCRQFLKNLSAKRKLVHVQIALSRQFFKILSEKALCARYRFYGRASLSTHKPLQSFGRLRRPLKASHDFPAPGRRHGGAAVRRSAASGSSALPHTATTAPAW